VTPNAQGVNEEPLIREWPFATAADEIGILYSGPSDLPVRRCVVLQGEDLAIFLPAIDDQLRETRWLSDGEYYALYPRPLLPDETGCDDPR